MTFNSSSYDVLKKLNGVLCVLDVLLWTDVFEFNFEMPYTYEVTKKIPHFTIKFNADRILPGKLYPKSCFPILTIYYCQVLLISRDVSHNAENKFQ